MSKPYILILLPDGVGLRNFAYSRFPEAVKSAGLDMKFWNNTPFDLSSLGIDEIKIRDAKPRAQTDVLRRVRSNIDLARNVLREGDAVYNYYRQRLPVHGLKARAKSFSVKAISFLYGTRQGLVRLRSKIKASERKSRYYAHCVETLRRERPALVFCTNQRPLTAIAPILAAQDLGIPTAAFIFSWDNVPKATMVIETDYYFVWSEHMKGELLHYYPYIPADRIFVTGTPQFESHFDASLLVSRADFFGRYGLDASKKYICYSGDDITTSPNDPQYLDDVAAAVRRLNADGHDLGVLFRRCPVDFSARFDEVLQKNNDVVWPIAPEWKKMGEVWNSVLPTPEDVILQANTIAHTEMVVNLGSSMVFDYVAHKKPCAFVNYDPVNNRREGWSVNKIYNYVHFRSMPDKDAVIWLDNPHEIAQKIAAALADNRENVKLARDWFEKINQPPAAEASGRIANGLKSILSCT